MAGLYIKAEFDSDVKQEFAQHFLEGGSLTQYLEEREEERVREQELGDEQEYEGDSVPASTATTVIDAEAVYNETSAQYTVGSQSPSQDTPHEPTLDNPAVVRELISPSPSPYFRLFTESHSPRPFSPLQPSPSPSPPPCPPPPAPSPATPMLSSTPPSPLAPHPSSPLAPPRHRSASPSPSSPTSPGFPASPTTTTVEDNIDLPMPASTSTVPLVTPLRGLDTFFAWESSLLANLRYHGLEGFLDERRQLAKGIIKCSADEILSEVVADNLHTIAKAETKNNVGVPALVGRKRKRTTTSNAGDNIGDNIDDERAIKSNQRATANQISSSSHRLFERTSTAGPSTSTSMSTSTRPTPAKPTVKAPIIAPTSSYNPKIKNPRVHYNTAVAAMAGRAALTGHTAALVRKFCEANRADCDSLAAYQHLLTDTRRRLTSLGADPGEAFAVWVAIAGLREHHRRWHSKLVTDLAAGCMDWDTLMAAMAERACREKQRSDQP
ncbi:hypothetical protein SCUCBS95973_006213 [Sporothrix curviconia]|uniref:Uncharacterized protein n=1 Tax=Sporothrix curviconia TaxID=1260050 RepID=A0ABP0C3B5_9PEZI